MSPPLDAPPDEAQVQSLVQTTSNRCWACRQSVGPATPRRRNTRPLGLMQVPPALISMSPSRLPALAALLDHADPIRRITAAATLSAEMPDRAKATLREFSAARPGTTIAQQAQALLQKLSER